MYSGNERSALVGKAGEDFVAQYLKSKGYIIIKRNWRDSRFGELDIVAESPECIAFVEVKTRKEASLISGSEAVDAFKRARIIKTAEDFLSKTDCTLQPRFDVAEVTVFKKEDGKTGYKLHYISNAF